MPCSSFLLVLPGGLSTEVRSNRWNGLHLKNQETVLVKIRQEGHLPDPHTGIRNPNRQGSKQFLKVLKREAPASACVALTTVLFLNHDLLRKKTQVIPRPGVSCQVALSYFQPHIRSRPDQVRSPLGKPGCTGNSHFPEIIYESKKSLHDFLQDLPSMLGRRV